MKFGSPFSATYGSPEFIFSEYKTETSGERIRVEFVPRLSGWFGVYRNSQLQTNRYAAANERVVLWIPADFSVTRQVVSVLRCGEIPYDMQRPARWYDQLTSKRATVEWWYDYDIVGSVNPLNGQTKCTGWTLTGLLYAHVVPLSGLRSRGTLSVALVVSGSAVSVTLTRAGQTIASGSGTVGSSVTLSGDAVSGSVTIAANAVTGTETLYIRWPSYMHVLRGTSNPPVSIHASVPFRGNEEGRYTETADLTAGSTYYYRLQPESDTGELGGESSTLIVSIPAPPAPPSNLSYKSGNADSLTLGFDLSTTSGASHSVYVQQPSDAYMNWAESYSAYMGFSGFSGYAGFSGLSYSGTTRVDVRASYSGCEEKRGTSLYLEFDDAGNYVPARPNIPSITSVSVTSGLTLAVSVSYDPAREAGTATHCHLYMRTPTGTYPATPDGSANLADSGGSMTATVTATAPATGWYWLKAVAVTAANIESASGAERLEYVSDLAGTAPVIQGQGTRG